VLPDPRPGSIHRSASRTRKDLTTRPYPRRNASLYPESGKPARPRPLPGDVLACNCASCTVELIVDKRVAKRFSAEPLAGRVDGRPYCKDCLPRFRKEGS